MKKYRNVIDRDYFSFYLIITVLYLCKNEFMFVMWSLGVVFILFIGIRNLLFCINYSCELNMLVILTLFVFGEIGRRKPPKYFFFFFSEKVIGNHEAWENPSTNIITLCTLHTTDCSWPYKQQGRRASLCWTWWTSIVLCGGTARAPKVSQPQPCREEWLSSIFFTLSQKFIWLSHGIVMFGNGKCLVHVKNTTHATSPARTAFNLQWVVYTLVSPNSFSKELLPTLQLIIFYVITGIFFAYSPPPPPTPPPTPFFFLFFTRD